MVAFPMAAQDILISFSERAEDGRLPGMGPVGLRMQEKCLSVVKDFLASVDDIKVIKTHQGPLAQGYKIQWSFPWANLQLHPRSALGHQHVGHHRVACPHVTPHADLEEPQTKLPPFFFICKTQLRQGRGRQRWHQEPGGAPLCRALQAPGPAG